MKFAFFDFMVVGLEIYSCLNSKKNNGRPGYLFLISNSDLMKHEKDKPPKSVRIETRLARPISNLLRFKSNNFFKISNS
ncbi:hypothetical protein BZG01_03040 [Labilibaculum manganireducens]|uniref:Uncharacterized protein n=1 Tax=Labilibaculum manganireducens TaxID=1940525 RepID=A0A2N3IEI2_9BACT|nr:hypothetical protein BZG01_03040 [Labilibaculum manganireducens]